MRGPSKAAKVVGVVLALALLAVVLVVRFGSGGYEVTARFTDAGQLVKGGVVQVAGRRVGTIADVKLGDDGVAEVVMDLHDDVDPLPAGTTAQIRSLGLSGIANRFVDLRPGPGGGPAIPDGGRLTLEQGTGIVDLDAVLSSLDPGTRRRLQGLLAGGGKLFDGTAARDLNRTAAYLDPAMAEGRALARELTRDKVALGSLLETGATTARVLAGHDAALRRGLQGTATTLRAVADERAALDDLLRRGPGAAREVGASLDGIGRDLQAARPALRDLSAAAPVLAQLARRLPPAATALRPVLADLRRTLPALDTSLRRLPPLTGAATPALASTTSALVRLTPILRGLRPYASDLVAAVFLGFGGTAGNTFDANGHLGRIAISSIGAAPGLSSTLSGGSAGTLRPQTGLTARCPGRGAVVAPDGSNDGPPDTAQCKTEQRRP